MDDQTKNLIQNHIDNNDVCLFMKGTPDAPQCGFSMAVSNMLKILEIIMLEETLIALFFQIIRFSLEKGLNMTLLLESRKSTV